VVLGGLIKMNERYLSDFDRTVPTNSGDVGIEQCLSGSAGCNALLGSL
jgi:hypothetical protein